MSKKETETKYVWVVTEFMATHPSVKRYELVESREAGVKVKMRDSTTFIRNAVERKFYFSEEAMIKSLIVRYARKMDLAKGQVTVCERVLSLLQRPPEEINWKDEHLNFYVIPAHIPQIEKGPLRLD